MADNPVPARLLDLSRLTSRAGKVLTGVDRVELAYLKAVSRDAVPGYGLVRTPLGFLLIDNKGMQALVERIEGAVAWGRADRLARVFGKLEPMQQRAMSDLRRLALARTYPGGLARMLRKHLPAGFGYLNVGHSNINDRVFHSVKYGAKGKIAVMIHDTIPLDHPLYQTPESVERFRHMLKRVQAQADLVIYNSRATRMDAERHVAEWGAAPPTVVAHLGVDLATPAPQDLPDGLPPEGAYFVTVGTIEPRKNHALLLEVWERLVKQTPPQEMPHLVICGSRGWMNEEVFFRMDRSALMGEHLHEHAGLSDGAIAALLEGAAGALYPSFAEGFGLPAIEAAARGVPVVCADLPATREILKDIPVYASLKDSYLWQRRIMTLARGRATRGSAGNRTERFDPPDWEQHFNKVFRLT